MAGLASAFWLSCVRNRPTKTAKRGVLLGLARGGACHARAVTNPAVRSYRTISPLPVPGLNRAIGGVFSVALSRTVLIVPGTVARSQAFTKRRVGVTHHRVLPCSDFPLAPFGASGRRIHAAPNDFRPPAV